MSYSKKRSFEEMDPMDVAWGVTKKYKPTSAEAKTNNGIFVIGNEIHFSCGINKDTIQEIIKMMSVLIHEHKEQSAGTPEKLTITYIVDSPGGSVTSVLKFVDYLNIVRSKYKWVKFVSIISGMSASAGTIMAIVADEKYITENAHAMIHELSAGNSSKYTELMSYMDYLSKLHTTLVTIYCDNTNKSVKEIEDLLRRETWFSAQEYYENGFVDGVKKRKVNKE